MSCQLLLIRSCTLALELHLYPPPPPPVGPMFSSIVYKAKWSTVSCENGYPLKWGPWVPVLIRKQGPIFIRDWGPPCNFFCHLQVTQKVTCMLRKDNSAHSSYDMSTCN